MAVFQTCIVLVDEKKNFPSLFLQECQNENTKNQQQKRIPNLIFKIFLFWTKENQKQ